MYLKHEVYPSPLVYVPGSKTEETVQFGTDGVPFHAKVSATIGKKLLGSDDISEVSEQDYEDARYDDLADLPMVDSKDGKTPRAAREVGGVDPEQNGSVMTVNP